MNFPATGKKILRRRWRRIPFLHVSLLKAIRMSVPPKTTARRFRVSGRVQGVGYRYFVYHSADQLQLKGYVRNLPDGDVEVYAIGELPQLDRLKEKLLQGPRMARVTHLDVSAAPVDPDYMLFHIEGG